LTIDPRRGTFNCTPWDVFILEAPWVTALAVSPAGNGSGMNLFAGTQAGGVFLSNDNGDSWFPVNTGLMNYMVSCLAVSPFSGGAVTNLFAGTNHGVFLSTNYGANWTVLNNGLSYAGVESFASSPAAFSTRSKLPQSIQPFNHH
jgi:hypothetical protein